MTEPALPDDEQDPFWQQPLIDIDGIMRQVRILEAAGKSSAEIRSWMLEAGCPEETADELLAAMAAAKLETASFSKRFGRTGALVGLAIGVTATAIYRPWTVRWVHWLSKSEIDPIEAVGLYWCGGFLAFTIMSWFMGPMFGAVIDGVRDRKHR